MKSTLRRRGSGFTIIEFLVVVLILSILMAIALPLYLASLSKSSSTTCRSNKWSIAHAEQAYRAQSSDHSYTTALSTLSPNIGTPVCPDGGLYSVLISDGTAVAGNGRTVAAGGLVILCTSPNHDPYAPGVDSQ